jgi:ribosomal protein L37AE/L43A
MSNMSKQVSKINIEEYQRFSTLLEGIEAFVKKHEVVSYIEFDYYVVHDMTLFSIEPDFDFQKLSEMIEQIKKSLPAIKRIFSKPIIVLKDEDDVLPVENTRIINQNTLLHLANHSQYVSNISKKGIKPRKLLTRIYDDDYSIYENIIFCNFIDETLALIKKNRRTLNSLLYASNIMKFNLLEKVNHLKYFLALGKLHTGYIRDFSRYFNLSKELLKELSHISQTINPRLHKPIYRKNIKRNKNLNLKKTNIFLMQKDYRRVYTTYKFLLGNKVKIKEEVVTLDYEHMRENFLIYVQLLTIFSVGHFNFEIDPKFKMNLSSLDLSFKYKNWTLDIFTNNKKETILHFNKDKVYKMILVGNDYDRKTFNQYKKDYGIDEMVVVDQFETDYLDRKHVLISIEDIDSFRRIQQIILKGMIYSDTKRDVCPFCGGKLVKDTYQDLYQCDSCMTQIKKEACKETRKSFFYTDIAHLKKHVIRKSDFDHGDTWYYDKQVESLMYYRNITRINEQGDIVCPHCNKVHEN